jgi:hypothetical protein
MHTLNGRNLGEQTARVRFLGPNPQVVLEEALPPEDEETLISDPRGHWSPSEIVEQRLTALLLLRRLRSNLGLGGRPHDHRRVRPGVGALHLGGAGRSRILPANGRTRK